MTKRGKIGIGLDVGSRRVQLAVLRSRKGRVVVERVASRELSHDAIVEGSVMDSQVVCEKIEELLREHHLSGKEAALGVSGRRVMIKKIATEEMSDEELSAAIAYEARTNLPFDTSEVCLDYARLPQDGDTGRMDVLLVAAKNEMVFDAAETLRWAGGKPALLEAEPFALQAALTEAGYLTDQGAVAALHIGFQSTDVTVFDQGQFEGNRDLNVGGKTYVEGLIRELGITFERAAALLGRPQRTEDEDAVLARIAVQVAERLADQVERGFPEFFGVDADRPVVRVVLCGGGAALPLLESELRRHFSVEVVVANPFRNFEVNGGTVDPALLESAPDYTAAVGLALRALGEEHGGFNLLFPTDRPQYRRRHYAGFSTVVPVVAGSTLLLGIVMVHLIQDAKISSLQGRLEEIRKETDLYRDKIALVEELAAKRADVATRIDVIAELDRNRFARIQLAQVLNNTLPELTWITEVAEVGTPRGSGFNLTGMTSSNLKVSQLMTNLLRHKEIRGVDLLVSEQTELAGVAVTRFTLQVVMPDLGLAAPPVAKPVDQIKRGAEAVREQRRAQQKLNAEASK